MILLINVTWIIGHKFAILQRYRKPLALLPLLPSLPSLPTMALKIAQIRENIQTPAIILLFMCVSMWHGIALATVVHYNAIFRHELFISFGMVDYRRATWNFIFYILIWLENMQSFSSSVAKNGHQHVGKMYYSPCTMLNVGSCYDS